MARFHLVKSGVVENTIEWANGLATAQAAYPDFTVIAATQGGPGWLWNGTTLSPPPDAPSVPVSISRLQLILGMTSAGLITPAEGVAAAAGTAIPAVIEAVFSSLPANQATGARIRWGAMTIVERVNPLVAAVAAASDKSESEMDQYFREWSVL